MFNYGMQYSLVFVSALLAFAPAAQACDADLETMDCHCSYTAPQPFDFYQGLDIIPGGHASEDPFTFDFYDNDSSYPHNSTIEDEGAQIADSPLIDVTSGVLFAKIAGTSKRGWTSSPVFRMLADENPGSVQRQDIVVAASFYPKVWQATEEAYQGLHLFARYQTENDLYVASLRANGSIYIWRKWCGSSAYTKIASHRAKDSNGNDLVSSGSLLSVDQWYHLRFEITGNSAEFYINDVKQFVLTGYDMGTVDLTEPFGSSAPGTLSVIPAGTAGIRTDFVTTFIDDFEMK